MLCKNCGAQIEDGSVFCPKCGNEIISSDENLLDQLLEMPESEADGIPPNTASNPNNANYSYNYSQQSAVLQPKKKIKLLFVLIPAVILVAVAIIILVLWTNGTFDGRDNYYYDSWHENIDNDNHYDADWSGDTYVNRYNDYVMAISTIADDEEYIVNKYQSMFDDNLDDYDMYTTLKDDIIPKAKDFIKKLEEIRPKDKELREIHDILIDAWNKQSGAFTMMLFALENGDYAQMTEANDRLDMARKLFRDFQDALEDYRAKYGIELVGTNNLPYEIDRESYDSDSVNHNNPASSMTNAISVTFGSTFKYLGIEYIIGDSWNISWGGENIEIPLTVKNITNTPNRPNGGFYTWTPAGISTNGWIANTSEMRPGVSQDTYLSFGYDGDGVYTVEFYDLVGWIENSQKGNYIKNPKIDVIITLPIKRSKSP